MVAGAKPREDRIEDAGGAIDDVERGTEARGGLTGGDLGRVLILQGGVPEVEELLGGMWSSSSIASCGIEVGR